MMSLITHPSESWKFTFSLLVEPRSSEKHTRTTGNWFNWETLCRVMVMSLQEIQSSPVQVTLNFLDDKIN